jgi:hypothetical protein
MSRFWDMGLCTVVIATPVVAVAAAVIAAVAVVVAARYSEASASRLNRSPRSGLHSAEGWSEGEAVTTDLLPLSLSVSIPGKSKKLSSPQSPENRLVQTIAQCHKMRTLQN